MATVSRALLMVGGNAGPVIPPGQIVYQTSTTGGATFNFVVPPDVTSISVVCVSPGQANGSGGNLAYGNAISVTPGETLTVVTDGPNFGQTPVASSVSRGGTVLIRAGTSRGPNSGSALSGGGIGGQGGGNPNPFAHSQPNGFGAGGAGGYTGNGGSIARDTNLNVTATGGAGGGGGRGFGLSFIQDWSNFEYYQSSGGGGGGVGLLGQGSSGTNGANAPDATNGGVGGTGGSLGAAGTNGQNSNFIPPGGSGGDFGGGGGINGGYEWAQDNQYIAYEYGAQGAGGRGAVRIIWPGTTRQFPSTNTGNL